MTQFPPSNAFQNLPDFGDAEMLARLGYQAFAVSVFDHHLSEEEAKTALFSYVEALEDGRMDEFLEGERRFLALYRQLAIGGVSLVRANGCLEPLKPTSRRFRELVVASVRERRTDVRPPRRARTRSMDVYFHLWDARVVGSWDRTDLFFCRSPEKLDGLHKLVREAGLHVLP